MLDRKGHGAQLDAQDYLNALALAARRGPATIYHTNIVPLAIQTAIVLQIAKLRSPEVLQRLERLQELRRRFGYEYSLLPYQQHLPQGPTD
jgi:hypothetical protein